MSDLSPGWLKEILENATRRVAALPAWLKPEETMSERIYCPNCHSDMTRPVISGMRKCESCGYCYEDYDEARVFTMDEWMRENQP